MGKQKGRWTKSTGEIKKWGETHLESFLLLDVILPLRRWRKNVPAHYCKSGTAGGVRATTAQSLSHTWSCFITSVRRQPPFSVDSGWLVLLWTKWSMLKKIRDHLVLPEADLKEEEKKILLHVEYIHNNNCSVGLGFMMHPGYTKAVVCHFK